MQYFLLSSGKIEALQTWTPSTVTHVNEDATTFGCLKPNSGVRRLCRRIVTHRVTQVCWVVLVCLSTALCLAIQPRYEMGTTTHIVFFTLQVVCLAFFWLRMLAEIVSSGLVEGRHSFLRSVWNWIEVTVNVFGILQVIPPTFHIRWMRAFAAARPLRFFVFAPWWKQLLVPVARGTPYIFDIFWIYTFSAFAFALIGVYAIGEELYQRCYITDVHEPTSAYAALTLPFLLQNVTTPCGVGFACPAISSEVTVRCLARAADYNNRYFSFQNVGAALLRVTKITTLDMWHEDLEEIMNVRGAAAALYPVAQVLVSQFLAVVAMTVVYNSYAHLDMWFVRSTLTKEVPEDRQRKDCGVQSVPLRQQPARPPPPTFPRSLRPHYDDDGDEAGFDNEHNGSLPALTAYASEETAAAQRYARDFVRGVHVRGVWSALRSLEMTTTAGPGREPLVRWAAGLVDSLPSALFMMALSLGNAVLLALVSVYTAAQHARNIRVASSAMAIYFLLPVLLKVIGFGLRRSLMDVWNYTDVFGAVTGILELAAGHLFEYRIVGLLRVLRYVHAVKYVFSFQQYHYQLWCLFNLVLVIAALLLLYSLLGMQLFGNAYVAGVGGAMVNGDFTTMWTALLACVRSFTGDLWTRYLTAVSRHTTVATGALFSVTLQMASMLLLFCLEYSVLFRGFRDAARDEDVLNVHDYPPLLLLPPIKDGATSTTTPADSPQSRLHDGTPSKGHTDSDDVHVLASRRRHLLRARNIFGLGRQLTLLVERDALFLISPFHPLRHALLRFFGSFFYLVFSTLWVLAGFVALFFERRHLDDYTETALKVFNIIYFAVFCCEMVAKWVAYGVFTPGVRRGEDSAEGDERRMAAYFREPLNWIDFAVNGTSLAGIVYAPLRIGRVLRTIRLCTTQERPNKTLRMLLASLRHVGKAVPLIFFLYVAFALAGMQIFAGGLHYCSDDTITQKAACVGTYRTTVVGYVNSTTVELQREWRRAAFHYDAFGPALLSVFAMTTVTHYGQFMDEAMAIRGTDTAMSYNHAGYYVLFVILALMVIRYYAARCVAAVLAAKLRRPTMASIGTALLSIQQTRFIVSRESIAYMLYLTCCLSPLPNRVSRFCHRVLTAYPVNGSDPLIYAVVNIAMFVVCAFVAATHVYAAPWQDRMLLGVECVGVAICGAEVLLGVVAYGKLYFSQLPRVFEVVLFACTVIGVAWPALRFFRVAFFVKLMKSSNVGMQLLPVVRHAKLLSSACAVYLLVLLVYAVVGTLLFGDIAPHDAYLTEKRNFHTVIGSLLVLFDCSTLDQWHRVMYACFDGAPCRHNTSATCGQTHSAVVFFVTFTIVVNFAAVQLVFAAMVNAFTVPLYVDVTQPFLQVRRVWLRHAGSAELKCDFDVFLRFLPELPASLTDGLVNEKGSEAAMIAFLSSLRLPLDNQLRLSYQDLLRGLAYRKYKIDLIDDGAEAYRRAVLLSITAGEHYGQVLRQRYCDEVTRLACAKVESVQLSYGESAAAASQTASVTDHDGFGVVQRDDFAVPRGAFPLPTSNVFLYAFPGESSERINPTSPP